MPIPRRSVLAAAIAPALLCGCNSAPTPSFQAGEPSSAPPSPSPSAVPSPTPSPTPSPAQAAAPAAKNISWYVSQVPKFDRPPKPEPVDVPNGQGTPWWSRVPTRHRVAFITIDDGGMARTSDALELIKRAGIPVTMFLNSPAAANHTAYFKAIQATGAHVQNHTVTHRNLKGQSYDFQHKEIKDCSDRLHELFGARPYLFRPPFGNYDSVTLKAARDCGMRVSFFWTQTVHEGIVRYQTPQKIVKPGDVLLMHFRPALADDLIGALKAMHDSGVIPARLEDYLPQST